MKADECTPKGEEWTPLMAASWSGHESVVQLLLRQQIDFAAHPVHSSRALTHAIERGHTIIAQDITMAFARPTAKVSASLSILSQGASSPLATATRLGKSQVVSLLLAHGATANSRWQLPDDESKHTYRTMGSKPCKWRGMITPLALAVSQNDMEMIEVLSSSSVSFEDYDYLSLAASTGAFGAVQFLLKQGLEVPNDRQRHSALLLAADRGYTEIVKVLLDHNRSLLPVEKSKSLIPDWFGHLSRPVAIKLLLLPAFTAEDAFLDACEACSLENIKSFLNIGISPDARRNGSHAIHLVLNDSGHWDRPSRESERLHALETLLDRGAQISQKDEHGNTCLHLAAKRGENEISQDLVSFGCPVNERNQLGETAADIVALQGNAAWLQQLLVSGADPDTLSWKNALKSGSIDTCNGKEHRDRIPSQLGVEILALVEFLSMLSQVASETTGRNSCPSNNQWVISPGTVCSLDSGGDILTRPPEHGGNAPLRRPASGSRGQSSNRQRGLDTPLSNPRRRYIPEPQRLVPALIPEKTSKSRDAEGKPSDDEKSNPEEKVRFVVIKAVSFPHDHIEIQEKTTDLKFLDDLQKKYWARCSAFKTYLSIHRFHHWGFDKYEHFNGNYISIASGCASSTELPGAPHDLDYDFKRLANESPPISQPIFYSHCYDCKPDCSRIKLLHSCTNTSTGKFDEECVPEHSDRMAELLSRVPKRLLEWQPRNLDHEVAYGLSSFELPNAWGFCIYSILCFLLPAGLFWIFWLSIMGHEADLQNASVPATLAVVLWVTLYQSTAGKRWCRKMQY
ncbi:ankyrin-1 [Colletotrichum lupini]|uniref:Ankyrin-1 n=1 Tax=Colletotrichum lupini TaxID=145971 RepID=A0A9Q8T8F6_9PEZI|nr:ankyrin-1 [Colletotrichum lupini]UQC91077.1 ankyrin-1 [Colletotrichum lupini]